MAQRLALGALIAALAVVPNTRLSGTIDSFRSLALFVIAVAGAWVVTTRPNTLRTLRSLPLLPLTLAFVWILLAAPFGVGGTRGLLVAAGLLGTVFLGAEIEAQYGFAGFERLLGPTLLLVLSNATLIELSVDNPERWEAWTEEPNALAILAAFGLVAGARAAADRVLPLLPLLVVSPMVLYQTEAIIPFVAGALGSLLIVGPRVRRGLASLAIASGLGVLGAVVASGLLGRPVMGEDTWETTRTLTGRTGLWDFIITGVAERPLTGFGPESSGIAVDGFMTWFPRHAHNGVIQMAVNGGWIPAALSVIALLCFLVLRRRHPNAVRDGYLMCFALISITEHVVREPTIPLLILAVGVASVTRERSRKRLVAGPLRSPSCEGEGLFRTPAGPSSPSLAAPSSRS